MTKLKIKTLLFLMVLSFPMLAQSDFDVYKYAEGVLKGKIEPVDNTEASTALDSVHSVNPKTRAYFFPVLRAMMNKGVEPLKKEIGLYLRWYAELYPQEYLANYKLLTDNETKAFNYWLAYYFCEQYPYEAYEDYTLSEKNYTLTLDNWINAMTSICKDCSSEPLLNKIKQEVLMNALLIHKDLEY